ncbi:unnamed protein product, partial [Amoebophrya sp. A25]|eukprot:GSA25T00028031001.1
MPPCLWYSGTLNELRDFLAERLTSKLPPHPFDHWMRWKAFFDRDPPAGLKLGSQDLRNILPNEKKNLADKISHVRLWIKFPGYGAKNGLLPEEGSSVPTQIMADVVFEGRRVDTSCTVNGLPAFLYYVDKGVALAGQSLTR